MAIPVPLKPRLHVKRFKDLTGMKFGLLTILSHNGSEVSSFKNDKQTSYSTWLAKCECGKVVIVNSHKIKTYGKHCGDHACKMKLVNINRSIKNENI